MTEALHDFIKGIATILKIKDEKIIKKGVELISLLNLKPHLKCSATCKGVICLDIASSFSPSPISKEDAIKYSGCKKKNYINTYNIISKLLNLDKIYSISEICLIVGICDVKEPALKLFEKFKNNCNRTHYDFTHPMYACAAVLAICRNNKIKVANSKLVEISRIKRGELDDLAKEFQALIEIKTTKKSCPKKQISDSLSAVSEEAFGVLKRKRKQTTNIMSDEEYLKWKKRMLEE